MNSFWKKRGGIISSIRETKFQFNVDSQAEEGKME